MTPLEPVDKFPSLLRSYFQEARIERQRSGDRPFRYIQINFSHLGSLLPVRTASYPAYGTQVTFFQSLIAGLLNGSLHGCFPITSPFPKTYSYHRGSLVSTSKRTHRHCLRDPHTRHPQLLSSSFSPQSFQEPDFEELILD